MKWAWQQILAFAIITIIAIVFIWLYFKPEPAPFDSKLLQMQYDSLRVQKTRLESEIWLLQADNKAKTIRIDTLEKRKPEIKLIYVNKSKEIDNANVGTIVNEFTGIFATGGIK
jgi:hypothetical protein